MQRLLCVGLASLCLVSVPRLAACADDVDKNSLQGVWIAQSMESDGKPAPKEAVEKMRFTFKGDKLLVKGNFSDDREEESEFKIDPKQLPKHLEFTPPNENKPILGIYEFKNGNLKICLRHASSSEGRPTTFETKPDSKLILIVFGKQKE